MTQERKKIPRDRSNARDKLAIGGGGRPDMAQAGGPDGAKANAALSAIGQAMSGA